MVQCILRKLASQDLPSLLRATWTCKLFEQTAEHYPVIWREAFLAPEPDSSEQNRGCSSDGLAYVDELDAEIGSLGGYKQLVLMKARYWRKAEKRSFTSEQKPAENVMEMVGGSIPNGGSTGEVARFLLLFRLRSRLIGWTSFTPSKASLLDLVYFIEPNIEHSPPITIRFFVPAPDGCDENAELQLLGSLFQHMIEEWTKTASSTLTEGRCVVKEKVSIQVYAFHQSFKDPGRLSARDGSPWDCRFEYSDTEAGLQYDFPACEGKVYLVSRERQLDRVPGCKQATNDQEVAALTSARQSSRFQTSNQ